MKLLPLLTLFLGYNQLVGAVGSSNIKIRGEVPPQNEVANSTTSASTSSTTRISSETKTEVTTKSTTKTFSKVAFTGTKNEDGEEEKPKPTSTQSTSQKYSEKDYEKAKKEVEKKKDELEKEIKKAAKKRKVTNFVNDGKNVFRTVSRYENETFKFWSEFRFATRPVPSFRVKFFDQSADGNNTLYSYQVIIPAVVEFNDQISADTTKSMKLLVKSNTSTWSNVSATTINIGDVSVTNFTTSYTDGKLTVRFSSFVTTGPANLNDGTAVSPNGVKFSVDVLGYDYKLTNSKLGLVMAISGKDDVVNSASSFSVGSGGVFGWVSNAICDGVNCAAKVEPVTFNDTLLQSDSDDETKGEARTYMVFSFDAIQPAAMLWDPSVDINDGDIATQQTVDTMTAEIAAKNAETPSSGSFAAVSLMVNAAALAIALAAF